MKTTLVIGASLNPSRYSYQAILRLRANGQKVAALSLKEGIVEDVKIQTGKPAFEDIDTVTLYINHEHQQDLEGYIYSLNPKRIIFNPGAENSAFMHRAINKGIDAFEACTLTMLSIGAY